MVVLSLTKIKKLADEIQDELCSAKEYAEKYVEYKASNDSQWAGRFNEMAKDELKHADYLHELAVNEINKLSSVYTPPTEMMEKWDMDHKKYVEKAAWIKQMLQL
jgi:hypothetical protein